MIIVAEETLAVVLVRLAQHKHSFKSGLEF
jgi:hypothetical protein